MLNNSDKLQFATFC